MKAMEGSRFSGRNEKRKLINITGGLLFVLIILAPVLSICGIKDDISCSSCHTMHNSQSSTSMTGGEAEAALLNSSCIGCHTGTNINPSISGFPYVLDLSAGGPDYGPSDTGIGGNTLAGGNFYWVTSDDRKGHNVTGIVQEDGELHKTPPGSISGAMSSQLTCAGEYGCHGDRSAGNSDLDSLRPGSHHEDDAPELGTTVPNSYRFLHGIKGFEDEDWEFTVSATTGSEDHNQYKGVTDNDGSDDTISFFCASCHGNFHGSNVDNGDNSSPWLRHPTEIDLPTSGEHGAYTSYEPAVPVASTVITNPLSDVSVSENRIIACVSCHRAHGSPWDSILRWDYKSWPNGGYNGCAVCHSYKD